MRKLIVGILTAALTVALLTIPTAQIKADDVFEWEIDNKTNTATLTGYHSEQRSLTIPSVVSGYQVTGIASQAVDCFYLGTLSIPNSVTSISTNAFYNASGLRQLTMPAETNVEVHAFSGLNHLKRLILTGQQTGMTAYEYGSQCPWFDSQQTLIELTIQNGVTEISEHSFEGYTLLQKLSLGNSIRTIKTAAFKDCTSLTVVNCSQSITEIGDQSFQGCTSLKSLVLSASLESIGAYAFDGCNQLIDIHLPASLLSIGTKAFNQIGAKALVVPQNTNQIGIEAFDPTIKLWLYPTSAALAYAQDSSNKYEIIRLMNREDSLKMSIGDVVSLYPNDVIDFVAEDMIWFSQDENVATVDSKGNVTAVNSGDTIVSVTTATGSVSCAIKVFRYVDSDIPVTDLSMALFSTLQLSPSDLFGQEYSSSKVYSYTSSNPQIASVDENGLITAHISGTADITVTGLSEEKIICHLTVRTPVGEIDADVTSFALLTTETYQLNCVIAPFDAYDQRLIYHSSNPDVLTVSSTGLIKAKGVGHSDIIISAADGQGASTTVSVTVNRARISVDTTVVPIPVGKYFHLHVKLASTINKIYTIYESADPDIATVDASGVVYGKSAGDTYITMYSSDRLVSCRTRVRVVDDAFSYGVDVSKWNGELTVKEWKDMKKDGISFAFIRAGYNEYIDSRFNNAYATAKQAGIKVGAYHFITALTPQEAEAYAKDMLKWLSGKKFEYPIMLDVEEAEQRKLSNSEFNAMVEAYCSVLKDAGYCVVVYSYASMLNKVNATLRSKYDMYVAQWNADEPSVFKYKYTIWQFTSSGRVNGSSGRFDMDICYFDYPSYIKKNHLNGY